MFKLIDKTNFHENEELMKSMFRLRKQVFVDKLKWPVAVTDDMEIDQFDTIDATHIVRIDSSGEVDACTRLMRTDGPYLLGDVFPQMVQDCEVHRDPDVWEITRFCSLGEEVPKNIVGQLVAAMLEFGITQNAKSFVSLSDIRIEPILRRSGWMPSRLGEPLFTGTEMSAGELYETGFNALEKVYEKSKITAPVLLDVYENSTLRVA